MTVRTSVSDTTEMIVPGLPDSVGDDFSDACDGEAGVVIGDEFSDVCEGEFALVVGDEFSEVCGWELVVIGPELLVRG